jgi:uncharacterized hydantoinase/oxoprolinase family protein
MSDEQNGQGKSRLDRLERLMQLLIDDHLRLSDEHKILLTAQVLQDDQLNKLTRSLKELEVAQKETGERLDALILTVDDLIRRPPA